MSVLKTIGLIGSTGSIGRQTLDIVSTYPGSFKIRYLSCHRQIDLMKEQIERHAPEIVAVTDPLAAERLSREVTIPVLSGPDALERLVASNPVDRLVTAVVGSIGLLPTLKAIDLGIDIALANKETLVTAGHIVMARARDKGVRILPVDSEHSALFQSLGSEPKSAIEKVILTASGGPFRGKKRTELEHVSKRQALKHPNWSMGQKISIDSATMMNKGLEVIEAKWLFDLAPDQIDVVVHPQSLVHSMVQFVDGSVIGQMGPADMRGPIVYALTYPGRVETSLERLDFSKGLAMTFEAPDRETFPCLALAESALRVGGSMPTVLNKANEVLVAAFLQDKIGFYDIPREIERLMADHRIITDPSVEDVLAIEREIVEKVGVSR